ncbi:uncharacterized protein SPPG_05334 [Spizellomyces punctatus DAOM BR117]|uniref:GAIN-B domain-containing protein n=1 Tax=Spizellomyces punctatus (strain DAOM BR117) TaxID=645134 RepID=A0A0L0HFW0_SPIPD|nr:uncharacterized protein SPPG_05334 [Spizellomyces punctatus DAOM BR117]KNC99962.1 hypothetical protein SPPG_05334 [Spizellomyces punctatus DAOM BR117]|eukprot:XP_016608002.1 hypothetical protein SPPG_05334 [Spizellomyces punctatus DAOM BR117]
MKGNTSFHLLLAVVFAVYVTAVFGQAGGNSTVPASSNDTQAFVNGTNGNGTWVPPPDGNATSPFGNGTYPPLMGGNGTYPPGNGTYPPPMNGNGTYPPGNGTYPPPMDGNETYPSGNGTYPPPMNGNGTYPQNNGTYMYGNGTYCAPGNETCYPPGNGTYPPPYNGNGTYCSPGNGTCYPPGNGTYPPPMDGNGTYCSPGNGTCYPPGNGTYPPPMDGNGTYCPPGNEKCYPPGNGTYPPPMDGNGTYCSPGNGTCYPPGNGTYPPPYNGNGTSCPLGNGMCYPSGNGTYPPPYNGNGTYYPGNWTYYPPMNGDGPNPPMNGNWSYLPPGPGFTGPFGYPLYPVYNVEYNGMSYDVTWVSVYPPAQPGTYAPPYPYPIWSIADGSKNRTWYPLPYPFPCPSSGNRTEGYAPTSSYPPKYPQSSYPPMYSETKPPLSGSPPSMSGNYPSQTAVPPMSGTWTASPPPFNSGLPSPGYSSFGPSSGAGPVSSWNGPSFAPSSVGPAPSGAPSSWNGPSFAPSSVGPASPSGAPSSWSGPSFAPSSVGPAPSGSPSSWNGPSSVPSGSPSPAPSSFDQSSWNGPSSVPSSVGPAPSGSPSSWNVPSSVPSGSPSPAPSSFDQSSWNGPSSVPSSVGPAPSGAPSSWNVPSSVPSGSPSPAPSSFDQSSWSGPSSAPSGSPSPAPSSFSPSSAPDSSNSSPWPSATPSPPARRRVRRQVMENQFNASSPTGSNKTAFPYEVCSPTPPGYNASGWGYPTPLPATEASQHSLPFPVEWFRHFGIEPPHFDDEISPKTIFNGTSPLDGVFWPWDKKNGSGNAGPPFPFPRFPDHPEWNVTFRGPFWPEFPNMSDVESSTEKPWPEFPFFPLPNGNRTWPVPFSIPVFWPEDPQPPEIGFPWDKVNGTQPPFPNVPWDPKNNASLPSFPHFPWDPNGNGSFPEIPGIPGFPGFPWDPKKNETGTPGTPQGPKPNVTIPGIPGFPGSGGDKPSGVVPSPSPSPSPVVPVIDPCPVPPRKASIVFSGSALVDPASRVFKPSGSGQANLAVEPFQCQYAYTLIYWNVDLVRSSTGPNTTEGAGKPSYSLMYPLPLQTLSASEHTVTAQAMFVAYNGRLVANVTTVASFSIKKPLSRPLLSNLNGTVSGAVPLVLDASDTVDGIDPCYFVMFKGYAAWKKCLSLNPGSGSSVAQPVVVVFSCQNRIEKTPCPFNLTSTTTVDQILSGRDVTNTTFRAFEVRRDDEEGFLYIGTDTPYFTIPVSSLRPGDYIFRVFTFRSEQESPPKSPPVNLMIETTKYYAKVALTINGVGSTFVGGSSAYITSNVVTNSPDLVYNWALIAGNGGEVSLAKVTKPVGKGGLKIDSSQLDDGQYTVYLTLTDSHNTTATAATTFSVTKTLPPISSCSISPSNGQELTTLFTVSCSDISVGSYYYSYRIKGVETGIAYPGSSTQSFLLPSGFESDGYRVEVRVRSYIPGTLYISDPYTLYVNVTAQTITDDNLSDTYVNLFSSGSSSLTVAAMESFTSKLLASNTTSEAAKNATGQVIQALTGTIDASTETAESASSKTEALAKLLDTGAVDDSSKANVGKGVAVLAQVLATTGADQSTLENLASAALGSVVSSDSDSSSGDTFTETMGYVGDALSNTLSPGENATISVQGTRLDVVSATIESIPDNIGEKPSNPARRLSRRAAATSCSAQVGESLQQTLNDTVGDTQVVVIKSTCVGNSPYPVTANDTNAGSSTLTAGMLTLKVNVDGVPFNDTLEKPIRITIPTSYTSTASLHRRYVHALTKRSTTTYTAHCAKWESSTSAWNTTACSTLDTSTGGSSTTCDCTSLGSYSIVIKAASTPDGQSPGDTPDSGSSVSKGVIAGATVGSVVGVVIVAAGIWYFLLKKPAKNVGAPQPEMQQQH